MDAMKAYADLGGRVFLSHWHNIWIEGATQSGGGTPEAGGVADDRDVRTTAARSLDRRRRRHDRRGRQPEGRVVRDVDAERRRLDDARLRSRSATAPARTRARRSTREGRALGLLDGTTGRRQRRRTSSSRRRTRADPDPRCGKVVFSDMHVSGGSTSARRYARTRAAARRRALTPQEKALAFMFFDIASCVGTVLTARFWSSPRASDLHLV